MERRRRHFLPLAVLSLALVAGGCAHSSPADQQTADPPEVTVRVINEAGYAEALKAQRGKVVLVDFWATWCGPCKELFPHTVQLHQRLAHQGLAVISVSLDDPENIAAVRSFLAGSGATFLHFISEYNVGPKPFEVFQIDDGALPHWKLYDRQGRLYKSFASGGKAIDPGQIDRAVQELLKQ